jgi:sporulation protein YlmC with PRC-barrel domain
MRKTMTFVSAALASVVLLSGAAKAQGTPQTVDIAKIDVQQLSADYRASKVIGNSVLNDANETIGKVDDLLISPDGKTPFTVLSIGGFLGMDSHYVVVPYNSLNLADNKVVLPGGTKDMLRMLPEFKYAAK